MNRKVQIVAALILTVVVGAVFYYAFIAPQLRRAQSSVVPDHLFEDTGVRHPLTGIRSSSTPEFFAASVMYDNFSTVKVRPGLEQAGIIYEALAEGGITRLMAIFDSSVEVARFGPIRSVRPYFIDWASEYGGILMHVGGSPEALTQLRSSDDIVDIDQIGAREVYFNRDESIKPPHNVFSSFSSWLQLDERMQIPRIQTRPWRYTAEQPKADVQSLQQIDIIYSPTLKISWAYNKEKNNYVRFVNSERQLFSSGDTLAATNLIILGVTTETIDSIGRQRMKTLGKGPAQIYRNGVVVTGTWIKDTRASRMRFVSDAQEEIALTPGTTWVSVVPSLDLVSYSSDTTPKS